MNPAAWTGEAKYRAILAVAEAANAHLDLSAVLDAVAVALEALVPVDGIGVVARDGGALRPLGAYFRATPRRSDESGAAYVDRLVTGEDEELAREMRASLELLESERRPAVVSDVVGEARLPLSYLKRRGVRTLALLPLTTGPAFVGGLVFARTTPPPFDPDETAILDDVCRPLGSAVANALAFGEIRRLRARLEDENLALREEIAAATALGGIIGSSPALRGVLDRVARVAATDATVLVTGETGTGKELVARAIHQSSARAKRALIKVNCAALPEGLVAAELFGHERGAFTGAIERRRGRFELANGGTIFLDEIGEVPAAMQAALLRVLQEGDFERVGGSETLRTDVRVVAATNRNLEDAGARRQVPKRPPLPSQRVPDRGAAAARAPGGHPAARRVLRDPVRTQGRQARVRHQPGGGGHPGGLPVAGQRAGAAEPGRAGGHPRTTRGAQHRRLRAAEARPGIGRLGTGGSHDVRGRRARSDRGRPSRGTGARRRSREAPRARWGSRAAPSSRRSAAWGSTSTRSAGGEGLSPLVGRAPLVGRLGLLLAKNAAAHQLEYRGRDRDDERPDQEALHPKDGRAAEDSEQQGREAHADPLPDQPGARPLRG